MYLAVPVVFVWLLFMVNSSKWKRFSNTPLTRWFTRGALVGILAVGILAVREKNEPTYLSGLLANEIANANICHPEPVEDLYSTAREVQKAADMENASLIAVGDYGGLTSSKILAYGLPCITTCDSIFASTQERRAWRVIEATESYPDKILLLGIAGGVRVGGGNVVVFDASGKVVDRSPAVNAPLNLGGRGGRGGLGRGGGGRGGFRSQSGPYSVPDIYCVNTDGRSAYDTLRSLGANVLTILTPRPTPDNPNPTLQVQRSNWNR
jgi:hypothetical protein